MAKAKKAVPEGYSTVTPILTLDDTRKALDWYKSALGARELHCAFGPDGETVMHAEMQIGNAHVMLHDVMPGEKGPKGYGGSPAGLWVFVDDCGPLFKRAVAAGGKVKMAMGDQFWGDRCGILSDPFGYTWVIATHKEDLNDAEIGRRQEALFKKGASLPA